MIVDLGISIGSYTYNDIYLDGRYSLFTFDVLTHRFSTANYTSRPENVVSFSQFDLEMFGAFFLGYVYYSMGFPSDTDVEFQVLIGRENSHWKSMTINFMTFCARGELCVAGGGDYDPDVFSFGDFFNFPRYDLYLPPVHFPFTIHYAFPKFVKRKPKYSMVAFQIYNLDFRHSIKMKIIDYNRKSVSLRFEHDSNGIIYYLKFFCLFSNTPDIQPVYFDLTTLPTFSSVFGASIGAPKYLTYRAPFDYSAEYAEATSPSKNRNFYTEICCIDPLSYQRISYFVDSITINPDQTLDIRVQDNGGSSWSCFGGYVLLSNPDSPYYQYEISYVTVVPYDAASVYSMTLTSILKYNPLLCNSFQFIGMSRLSMLTSGVHYVGVDYLSFTLSPSNQSVATMMLKQAGDTNVDYLRFVFLTFSDSKEGCRASLDAQINGPDPTASQNVELLVKFYQSKEYIVLLSNKHSNLTDSIFYSTTPLYPLPSFLTAKIFSPPVGRSVSASINPFSVSLSDEINYNFLHVEANKWNLVGYLNRYYQGIQAGEPSESALTSTILYASSPGLSLSMNSYMTVLISRLYAVNLATTSSCNLVLTYSGLLRAVFVNSHFMFADSSRNPATMMTITSSEDFLITAPSEVFLLQIVGRLIQISSVTIVCTSSGGPVSTTITPYAIKQVESPPVTVSYPATDSCPGYCVTCRKETMCILCAENHYLYNGLCVEICPSDKPFLLKRKYCSPFEGNQFTYASPSAFDVSITTVSFDYEIDPFDMLDGFVLIFSPYPKQASNTMLFIGDIASSPTSSEAVLVLSDPFYLNQTFNMRGSAKLALISSTPGTYTLNLYIYSLISNVFLVTKFSSLANLFGDSNEYVPDISAFTFSPSSFYKIQFILHCLDTCYLKFGLIGSAKLTSDQRTVLFEASSSLILNYQLTISFKNVSLLTIDLSNCPYFKLSIIGNYRIFSLRDYYGYDDSLSAYVGSCSIPGCANCESNTICKSCSPGFFLTANLSNCVERCASTSLLARYERRCACQTNQDCSSLYPICNSLNGFCYQCSSSCSMCQDDPNNCITCANNYFKHQSIKGHCVKQCDYNFYPDFISMTCNACHPLCWQCNGPTNNDCLGCQSNAWGLGATTCVEKCPENYYGSFVKRQCVRCHDSCSTCSGPSSKECLTCAVSFFYPEKGVCVPCDTVCKTCRGPSARDCITCNDNHHKKNGECVSFNCPSGFYGDSTSEKCVSCPLLCLTCKSATSCITCSENYIMQNKACLFCTQVKGFHYKEGKCKEICGDGLNYGLNQCDDGNTDDDDGCSSDCRIESGWSCSGGSSYSRDVCTRLTNVFASIQYIPYNPVSILAFTSPVFPQAKWDQIVKVYRTPDYKPITTFQTRNLNTTHYEFDFSAYDAPRNVTIGILIKTYQPTLLLDETSHPVFFKVLTVLLLKDERAYANEAIQTSVNVFWGISFTTLLLAGALKVLFGNLDVLQMVYYLHFVSIDYPKILNLLIGLTSIGGLDFLPNFFELAVEFSEEVVGKSPWKFEQKEIPPFFLLNSGHILFSWILTYIIKYVCLGLTGLIKKKDSVIEFTIERTRRKKHQTLSQKLYSHFKSMDQSPYIIGFYSPLAMGTFLQLSFWNNYSKLNTIVDILALLSILLLVLCPYFVYKMFQKSPGNNLEARRREIFMMDFDEATFWKKSFILFEFLEKIFVMLSLVVFWRSPEAQLFGMIGTKAILVTLLAIIKPFKQRKELLLRIFSEIIMISAMLSIFFMYKIGYDSFFTYSAAFFLIILIVSTIIRLAYHQLLIAKRLIKFFQGPSNVRRRVWNHQLGNKRKYKLRR